MIDLKKKISYFIGGSLTNEYIYIYIYIFLKRRSWNGQSAATVLKKKKQGKANFFSWTWVHRLDGSGPLFFWDLSYIKSLKKILA